MHFKIKKFFEDINNNELFHFFLFRQVLTERRISQLSKKPIKAVEFVAPLARIDPIYKEEEEAFKVRKQNGGVWW